MFLTSYEKNYSNAHGTAKKEKKNSKEVPRRRRYLNLCLILEVHLLLQWGLRYV